MLKHLTHWARITKQEITAIHLAIRDPRTPWHAKALATFVIAYALSPIDLIPDFIPVIGYLDDLILIPIGLWVIIKLIPTDVMEDCRARATSAPKLPASKKAAAIIAIIWLSLALLTLWLVYTASKTPPNN